MAPPRRPGGRSAPGVRVGTAAGGRPVGSCAGPASARRSAGGGRRSAGWGGGAGRWAGRCLAAEGSRRTLRRLSAVVTPRTTTMTASDMTMPISGAQVTPWPCSASRISLTPMNAEDHRQPDGQVDQPVEQPAEQEVQLPQSHQRERVRGEDQERLLGQPEDRRDRVEREQQVGRPDRQHHDEHRRDEPLPVDPGEHRRAVVVVGDRQEPADQPQRRVLPELLVLVVVPPERQPPAGVEQERPEQVEDPLELLDHRRPGRDEQPAQHQRGEDAEQQHLVLVIAGTPNVVMMITKTNRLSTDRLYSVM